MGGLHSGETGPSEMLMELVLPARDRDVAAHQADPRQRDRLDHAGRRSRRPRSQRRLVLPGTRRSSSAGGAAAPAARRRGASAAGGAGGGRRRAAAAVLGQVRLPRQQPRHQPVAGVDARDRRLVLHRASADHARPARGAAAALHLQRRSAAEPEPRSDPVRGAAVLLELRAGADDEVGHAGRLHARVHGRLVAGLSRLGRLQPQRHDADVRDAVRASEPETRRSGARRGDGGAMARAATRRRGRWRGGTAAEPAARGPAARTRHAAPTGRGGVAAARMVSRPADSAGRGRDNFSRRNNTNYMETGVLSGLQLTAMFPNLVIENFYQKTQNSIDAGKTRGAVRLRDSRCSAT